jgi:NADP-dependent 3-hydroxy acid dehydrogenase YdfG
MDLGLKDKVIFIAGASRGIGHGIAEVLLEEGAKVALTARGAEALEETRAEFATCFGKDKVWSFAGDLTQTAPIEAALAACEAEFGPITGAVANVGLSPSPLGFDVTDEDWQAGLDQNLNSAFRLARGAIPRMAKNGGGSFLFISSIAGLAALGTPLIYGATKAAVNHRRDECPCQYNRPGQHHLSGQHLGETVHRPAGGGVVALDQARSADETLRPAARDRRCGGLSPVGAGELHQWRRARGRWRADALGPSLAG